MAFSSSLDSCKNKQFQYAAYGFSMEEKETQTQTQICNWRLEDRPFGIVETIYEEEDFDDSSTLVQDASGIMEREGFSLSEDVSLSPWFLLENGTAVHRSLQQIVFSWSQATGFPARASVHVKGHSFNLHKFPLVSKSGFFKRELMDRNEIFLPNTFPEVFEIVAAFCYGATIVMRPCNIAALRCASEFLEMTEDCSRRNLCKRSEAYFKEVVLQSWENSIEVLKSCKNVHPLAEEMLIVKDCVEAVSQRAVTETSYRLNGENCVESCEDWWIHDLLSLPFDYFGQIIACIRRLGMQEKYISRAMLLYVDRWILEMLKSGDSGSKVNKDDARVFSRRSVIESIVRLLPTEKHKEDVPVSFLFALLRCALAWSSSSECRALLESRISNQLDQASISDFLLPLKFEEQQIFTSSSEIESMQRIVWKFFCKNEKHQLVGIDAFDSSEIESDSVSKSSCYAVARVWDEYLAEVAFEQFLLPSLFANLISTVPAWGRTAHDRLYKAIHLYLKTHPQISEAQKNNICRWLNCQKLSKEVCVHAVQNDSLPLRTVVQAMFTHQLRTTSSMSSSSLALCRQQTGNSMSHPRNVVLNRPKQQDKRGLPLGHILRHDDEAGFLQARCLKVDLQETSSRLRNLEDEISRMRTNLQACLLQTDKCPAIQAAVKHHNHNHNKAEERRTKNQNHQQQEADKQFRNPNISVCRQTLTSNSGCGSGVTFRFMKKLRLSNRPKHQPVGYRHDRKTVSA